MNADIERLADHHKPANALRLVKQLLAVHGVIPSSFIAKANAHYVAFQIAIMSRKTLPQAADHIRAVYEIYTAVCPFSRDTQRYAMEMKNPACSQCNYLSMERYPF